MNMKIDISLELLSDRLAVCRLATDAADPDWARPGELLALIRTRDELCVICQQRYVPPEVKAELGWRAFRVEGVLDLSQVGILNSISEPLTKAGVSIFVLSTYDTDYILVKEDSLGKASDALLQAGHLVINNVSLSA